MDVIQYLYSVLHNENIEHIVIQICCTHEIHTVARYLHGKLPKNKTTRKVFDLAVLLFATLQRTSEIEDTKNVVRLVSIIFDLKWKTQALKDPSAEAYEVLAGSAVIIPPVIQQCFEKIEENPEDEADEEKRLEKEEYEYKKANPRAKDSKRLCHQSPFTPIFASVTATREATSSVEGKEKKTILHSSVFFMPSYVAFSILSCGRVTLYRRLVMTAKIRHITGWPRCFTYPKIIPTQKRLTYGPQGS